MNYIYRNEIPQNTTDMMTKIIDEMAKATSQVLETFLCEYCEVNGIREGELKDVLVIEHVPITGAMTVKQGELTLLRSTFEVTKEEESSLRLTFFLCDKERFPKTLRCLQNKKEKISL